MYNSTLLKSVSKPARYTGGEFNQVIKDKSGINCRFAFCFPDTYEIGMSNLGMRILYGVLNEQKNIWCERVFAPWIDMEAKMRENGIRLSALESGDLLTEFDFVGFTMQYELCYSNVLNMLDLAGIPLYAKDRGEEYPLIIGGGPCTYNPEPVAEFFDIFSIGEGEEALPELCALYTEMKKNGEYTKERFLRRAAALEGFYVPSLYDVAYENGSIASFKPKFDDVPAKVKKRIIKDLDKVYFPKKLVIPFIETVQDRTTLEVFRGCIRGCRFCQAGFVYRPVREKSADTLNEQAKEIFKNTGYDEISLSSLSISDYTEIEKLTDMLLEWTDDEKINLSLPSLRVDSFNRELMDRISSIRSAGLTFAPEAGTQRMRNVINKNVTEEDIKKAVNIAYDAGKTTVKLYFMQGLPTETDEDIVGIGKLAETVVHEFFINPNRNKKRRLSVTVSVACFIPKPFTPFQWEPQDSLSELSRKQRLLMDEIKDNKINYNYHDAKVSKLEAVFARGSRRLSPVLAEACRRGIRFDAWDETFDYDKWQSVFDDCGVDMDFFANREIERDEILPWDVIDCGVTKEYLAREREKAKSAVTTENCRANCGGCGAATLGGERSCCLK